MTAINMTIPAAYLDAALCAVSKEETRYYLRGVFLDARGYIAATNGHIAFAAAYPDAACLTTVAFDLPGSLPGVIVPEAALKAVAKGKGGTVTVERDANGLWWLARGAIRTHFEPIDGSFPDWTRIVPEAPTTETAAHYQPQYVAALGAMASALRDGKKGNAFLYHIHQAGEAPALVTFPRECKTPADKPGARLDCCAVLMPMRNTNHSGFDRAAFLSQY